MTLFAQSHLKLGQHHFRKLDSSEPLFLDAIEDPWELFSVALGHHTEGICLDVRWFLDAGAPLGSSQLKQGASWCLAAVPK